MLFGLSAGDVIMYCLVALLTVWTAYGFIMLIIEETQNRRRPDKKAQYARDHFRKTQRYYDDI